MLNGVSRIAVRPVFQSAPGREAGRCAHPAVTTPSIRSFNPRPAVRPGDAFARFVRRCLTGCFNPRPAVRPGDAREGKCPT